MQQESKYNISMKAINSFKEFVEQDNLLLAQKPNSIDLNLFKAATQAMQELFGEEQERFDEFTTQVAMYGAYTAMGSMVKLLDMAAQATAIMLSEEPEHKPFNRTNKPSHGNN